MRRSDVVTAFCMISVSTSILRGTGEDDYASTKKAGTGWQRGEEAVAEWLLVSQTDLHINCDGINTDTIPIPGHAKVAKSSGMWNTTHTQAIPFVRTDVRLAVKKSPIASTASDKARPAITVFV